MSAPAPAAAAATADVPAAVDVHSAVLRAVEEISKTPSEEGKSYIDFFTVQVKSYKKIVKVVKDNDEKSPKRPFESTNLPQLTLSLLTNCPSSTPHLRLEILKSLRDLINTSNRSEFAPSVEALLRDSILLGESSTTRNILCPIACSAVYDLLFKIRELLNGRQLTLALDFCIRNLGDGSLGAAIHVGVVKTIISLVDVFGRTMEKEKKTAEKVEEAVRPVLMRIVEVLTDKIVVLAKYVLPVLITPKTAPSSQPPPPPSPIVTLDALFPPKSTNNSETSSLPIPGPLNANQGFDFPTAASSSGLPDCRLLVRWLFIVLKSVLRFMKNNVDRVDATTSEHILVEVKMTCGPAKVEAALAGANDAQVLAAIGAKMQVKSRFIKVKNLNRLVKLFENGLKVLDQLKKKEDGGKEKPSKPTKEDLELMDLFCAIFYTLGPQTFRYILSQSVTTFITSLNANDSLLYIAKTFLIHRETSYIFCSVLLDHLVTRMEIMGTSTSLSTLHLTLFKLIFGTINRCFKENELALQSNLETIITRCMDLGVTTAYPLNYFYLLRSLFRSIDDGTYAQLYEKIRPMLPGLLQSLSQLQAAVHQPDMKELLIELCCVVPVRVSALLPHLQWLMGPLVSALICLNPAIAQQGLRTLEMCIDNFQPDFLSQRLEAVKAEMMTALWALVRKREDVNAKTALRILGKLGQRLIVEPQMLQWREAEWSSGVSSQEGGSSLVSMYFTETSASQSSLKQVELPIDKIISTAYDSLRNASTNSNIRHQCWEVIKGFFISHTQTISSTEERTALVKLFNSAAFTAAVLPSSSPETTITTGQPKDFLDLEVSQLYQCADSELRKVATMALSAMLTAAAIKELYQVVIGFLCQVVRYYTMVAIIQEVGPSKHESDSLELTTTGKFTGIDPLVLIDAIVEVMGQEKRELIKPCLFALQQILETTVLVLGSRDRASQLPLFEYILVKMAGLCYGPSWYSKYGGCIGVKFLVKTMAGRWLMERLVVIVKVMLNVVLELDGVISAGVIEVAKDVFVGMLKKCAGRVEDALVETQKTALGKTVQELIKDVTSPSKQMRELAMEGLRIVANCSGKTVTEVILPFKEMLIDQMPPRKHRLLSLSPAVQIGLLEGNTFCVSLNPPLFPLDVKAAEHKIFISDVYTIANSDDEKLLKYPCYQPKATKGDLIKEVRKCCFKWLTYCGVAGMRVKVLQVTFKLMGSGDEEVQKCAMECLGQFGIQPNIDQIYIDDYYRQRTAATMTKNANLDLPTIRFLQYVADLFPSLLKQRDAEVILFHLNVLIDGIEKEIRGRLVDDLKIKVRCSTMPGCTTKEKVQTAYEATTKMFMFEFEAKKRIAEEMMRLLSLMTDCGPVFVEKLMSLMVVKVERCLHQYGAELFYLPVRRFMRRFPEETVQMLERRSWRGADDASIVFRFFKFIINGEEGGPFRAVLYEKPEKLMALLKDQAMALGFFPSSPGMTTITTHNALQRYQAIKLVSILLKYNRTWLATQPELGSFLKAIWSSETFHDEHTSSGLLDTTYWDEPKLLVKCLLAYFEVNVFVEVDLLFQLVAALEVKYHCSLDCLVSFTEKVVKTYSSAWKKMAYERFNVINRGEAQGTWSKATVSKAFKYIIQPMFWKSSAKTTTTTTMMPKIDDSSKVNLKMNAADPLPQPQPQLIKGKETITILDVNLKKQLYKGLLYITNEVNWGTMGGHYWVKQCIELILKMADGSGRLEAVEGGKKMPLPMMMIFVEEDGDGGVKRKKMKGTTKDSTLSSSFDVLIDLEALSVPLSQGNQLSTDFEIVNLCDVSTDTQANQPGGNPGGPAVAAAAATTSTSAASKLQVILEQVSRFLWHLHQTKSSAFITSVIGLCHHDATLAEHLWIQLFPRIFSTLDGQQKQLVAIQLAPFFLSGAHLPQRDAPISALRTFFEAVIRCDMKIILKPELMKYLATKHNLWHRVTLMLEREVEEADPGMPSICLGGLVTGGPENVSATGPLPSVSSLLKNEATEMVPAMVPLPAISYRQEAIQVLVQMYELLQEEDYWTAVWKQQAHYTETAVGVVCEQMGAFESAKEAYEIAMTKASEEFTGAKPAPHVLKAEYNLWEQRWVNCCKQLNQWDFLYEYAKHPPATNPLLTMESALHMPDWSAMKDALHQLDELPVELQWKGYLYKGYIALCSEENRNLAQVARLIDTASSCLLRQWRRLPALVTSIHLELLQASHQLVELSEGERLHQLLLAPKKTTPTTTVTSTTTNSNSSSSNEQSQFNVKAITKMWKNRLPTVADSLAHWSDIFTWRKHNYQLMMDHFEVDAKAGDETAKAYVLIGQHYLAQTLIHYAKVARKHGLVDVSLEALMRTHTIPLVPIMDTFQRVRQELKCYWTLKEKFGDEAYLTDGLDLLHSTHLQLFPKEALSELYALKGAFHSALAQPEDAKKSFSSATQLIDTLINAWALWGEFSENQFTANKSRPFTDRTMSHGTDAVIAYLHACRLQNEVKSRKYLAKVLWLLAYDDQEGTLAATTAKHNAEGVPAVNWLPWMPQLLQTLQAPKGGACMMTIVMAICRQYPQAVYWPVKAMYMALKMEMSDTKMNQEMLALRRRQSQPTTAELNDTTEVVAPAPKSTTASTSTTSPDHLTCTRLTQIINKLRDQHPLSTEALQTICDQLYVFRENWYEEILRQLRVALAKCYTVAFEHRASVQETPISGATFALVRKLISTFGIGLENVTGNDEAKQQQQQDPGVFRSQPALLDPVYRQMKQQFSADFDFTSLESRKLHMLISKFKKWIKILEGKTGPLPRVWLLEERCRYLANFSHQGVDIALPGEFLVINKGTVVNISAFLPKVEVVAKHGCTARRLKIRGQNGKLYAYLVLGDSTQADGASHHHHREERLLQLQRLLNLNLRKTKETARRLLAFTVPRVISISPVTRLIEDNISSISLFDIFKEHLHRQGTTIEPEALISKYYNRLVDLQLKEMPITSTVLRTVVGDIQKTYNLSSVLKRWAAETYSSPVDYWHFRKIFTTQLGLVNLTEHGLGTSRLYPQMLFIHRDTGLISVAYYRFDLSNRQEQPQVPFRLTCSLQELITNFGIDGPLMATIISTATCLSHENYKIRSILSAILKDEVVEMHRRVKMVQEKKEALLQSPVVDELPVQVEEEEEVKMNAEDVVKRVEVTVESIEKRLGEMTIIIDHKVTQLINEATSTDHLAQMDPAWHPWL